MPTFLLLVAWTEDGDWVRVIDQSGAITLKGRIRRTQYSSGGTGHQSSQDNKHSSLSKYYTVLNAWRRKTLFSSLEVCCVYHKLQPIKVSRNTMYCTCPQTKLTQSHNSSKSASLTLAQMHTRLHGGVRVSLVQQSPPQELCYAKLTGIIYDTRVPSLTAQLTACSVKNVRVKRNEL